MDISAGEKSVLAYFPSVESAGDAAGELRGMGYQTMGVDRISRHGAGGESLTGLTLYSAEGDFSGAGGLSSDTGLQQSGQGDADYGMEGGRAFLLTVVTGEGDAGQVQEVIGKHGGRV